MSDHQFEWLFLFIVLNSDPLYVNFENFMVMNNMSHVKT